MCLVILSRGELRASKLARTKDTLVLYGTAAANNEKRRRKKDYIDDGNNTTQHNDNDSDETNNISIIYK